MNKVRWGVLGAGGIARRRTIPEGILAAPNAELAAVFDVHDCAAIAAQFDARACATEDELLAAGCDAIYIATPVHLHADQVERAARAGRHVLCEKPLGLNVAEAEHIVACCERARVKLGVGLLMRFHACHREAARMIRDGAVGTPVFGRAQLSCWYPPMEGAWRQDPRLGGGGSLMDMGCHCIDLLEMLLGRARKVWCTTASLVQDYAGEDTAVAMIEHETGARSTVDTLFNVPDASSLNRLEVYGSGGSIMAEGTIGQGAGGKLFLRAGAGGGYDATQQRSGDDAGTIAPDPVNTYRAEIEAFSAAVLGGTAPPIDGAEGLWNQRVLAACYASAASGKSVTL